MAQMKHIHADSKPKVKFFAVKDTWTTQDFLATADMHFVACLNICSSNNTMSLDTLKCDKNATTPEPTQASAYKSSMTNA